MTNNLWVMDLHADREAELRRNAERIRIARERAAGAASAVGARPSAPGRVARVIRIIRRTSAAGA